MTTLLVGFDSAWTLTKVGAIVGVVLDKHGTVAELGLPRLVRYGEAAEIIRQWQGTHLPTSTLVLLDQPTIVVNEGGQRPVEQIVCPSVSRRRSGMQPANRGRKEMFGATAPVWEFLARFGGAANPFQPITSTSVVETYPVLAIIALGWTLPDPQRPAGRLPKYNPGRRTTFALADWAHVCCTTSAKLAAEGALQLAAWADTAARNPKPTKNDQDQLDACICLLAALHLGKHRDALFVGCCTTGYIVVPDSEVLRNELVKRCAELGRAATSFVRVFRLADEPSTSMHDA